MEPVPPSVDDEATKLQRQFGDRLRHFRTAAALSQEEIAHRAGLDRSFVGQVERGERNLSLLNILKIADALGIEAGRLFDRDK
ncbi:helix-turn-helix domain-containing protein [Rhizobium leguminosarum]|uniref:helix-turn-helix domain-containing protein n=1 Tax=Rhizobium leguminosarum TaxID=384 RepID=UPI0009B80148